MGGRGVVERGGGVFTYYGEGIRGEEEGRRGGGLCHLG